MCPPRGRWIVLTYSIENMKNRPSCQVAKLRRDHPHPVVWRLEKIRSPTSIHVQQVTLQGAEEAFCFFGECG